MPNSEKAVVVGLSGGLGNQMFQYAAGRALSLRLSLPLGLDTSWFLGRTDRHYALAPFNIVGEAYIGAGILPDIVRYYESRLSRRWAVRRMGAPIFREPHFHFDPAFEQIEESVFLEGYWQSERYFLSSRKVLLQDFSLTGRIPQSCQSLLGQIGESQSICVHVRRGDYLSNPAAAKAHGTCAIAYYQRGVEALSQVLSQPHCFIFSDDPEWVWQSLSLSCPSTVVDANSTADAHWDLFLMAACNHFVIANSSLSWWGAWMGSAPDKRVIAPERWFLTNEKDTQDLIPSNWERM